MRLWKHTHKATIFSDTYDRLKTKQRLSQTARKRKEQEGKEEGGGEGEEEEEEK